MTKPIKRTVWSGPDRRRAEIACGFHSEPSELGPGEERLIYRVERRGLEWRVTGYNRAALAQVVREEADLAAAA